MGNPDPFLSALKNVGLSVIRLPRPGIGPLTLLVRRGNGLTVAGRLDQLMKDGVLPQIDENQPAAGIAAQSTRELDASLGISLLGGWLEALGGSSAGLEAKFQAAKTIRFTFPSVLVDTVSSIAIDKYLGTARVDPAARQHAKALDNHSAYVITLAAKTTKFAMHITSNSGGGLTLDLPSIQQVIGGGVKVSAQGDFQNALQYEGTSPVYFGFQALRLFYRDGEYQGFRPLEAGALATLGERSAQKRKRVWFAAGSPFVAFSDTSDALGE